MPAKLLVDTPAWIAGFRGSGFQSLKINLIAALDSRVVVTTPIVVLELLRLS